MRSVRNTHILLAVIVCALAIPLLLRAQLTGQQKTVQPTVGLRIILAGPEGSPRPPGSALVRVSTEKVSGRSLPSRTVSASRSCTNTTGSQQPPANAVIANANGVCTLRYPPGAVLRLWATTDEDNFTVPGGPAGPQPIIINGMFTAFEGCQPHPSFPGSKRHCQLKLPDSGEAQVKASFSK